MGRTRRRRYTPWLVVGLLFVVVGTTVSRWVGEDDTIEFGTHTATADATGLAVVTHPEVTAFRNLGMRVVVTAPGGVFLAASHRVDTDDLLGERERYEISEVSRSHVGGRVNGIGAPAGTWTTLRPDRTPGWAYVSPDVPVRGLTDPTSTPRATGRMPTRAELKVNLDETEPVDFVAVPVDPDDRVTLTLGVFVDHLHDSQVSLARLGAFMMLWWALRRTWDAVRRRRERPPAHRPKGAPVPSAEENQPVDVTGNARTTRQADVRLPRTVTLPVLGLLLALAVSGCALPSATSSTGPAVHPLLTLDQAAAVSAATPVRIHSPSLTGYPLWAVVELPPKKGSSPHGRLQLLERRSFRGGWKAVSVVRMDAEAPRPLASAGPAAFARDDPGDTESRAEAAADTVARFWTTGRTGDLEVPQRTERVRAKVLREQSAGHSLTVSGQQGAPRVVPAASGSLVLVRHTVLLPQERTLTTALLLLDSGATVLGSTLK